MNCLKIKIPESREDWLSERRKGIGGSDAGTILGVNKWKTPYALWLEKTGQISDEIPDTEAMWFGREAEDLVAKRFESETGKKVKKSSYMFAHSQYPWMKATVDRLVVGEKAGLECKTANFFADSDYQEDVIPPSYYAQCMHYLAVTGLDRWYLAVLIPGKSFHTFVIERNEDEIQAMINVEQAFWTSVQERKDPPEVQGGDIDFLKQIYPGNDALDVLKDIDIDSELSELDSVKEEIKALDTKKKDLEAKLLYAIGDHEVAISQSGRVVNYKRVERSKFDTKQFKKDYPQLYEDYLETIEYRSLRIGKER